MTTPSEAVWRQLGSRPLAITRLAGALSLAELGSGSRVVVKRGAGRGANAAEAAGLRWLAEPGDVPIPRVYGWDETWLLTEYVAPAEPTTVAARAFGRGLAALHLRGAPAFGAAPPDGPVQAWIGDAPMRNEESARWVEFYAQHRIEPYLRSACDSGALNGTQAALIGAACAHLDAIAGPPEPPARLHGDAWSGNLLWSDGAVWLLDPAAHGGHRESDLAMMRLFGAPHLEDILDAYSSAAEELGSPLADGWCERVGLHQLFPLLVHTVLFGGGYADRAVAAARSALALR